MYGRCGTLALMIAVLPRAAEAGDLGEALDFIEDTTGDELGGGWHDLAEPEVTEALPMLVSRDVRPGAALDEYDCFDSAVDQTVLRTSGEEKWALRYCMRTRWKRDHLRGYRTLGEVRLKRSDVAGAIAIAARETHVPAALIDLIIQYSSGYRPGVISDDGHYGLMQLNPEHLRDVGLEFDNLLDPQENILVGARYLARLTIHFSDVKIALGAYHVGARAVDEGGGDLPNDRASVWFTRALLNLYYSTLREVPKEIGADSMAFVFEWLD